MPEIIFKQAPEEGEGIRNYNKKREKIQAILEKGKVKNEGEIKRSIIINK